jgi:hypothetical protein
MLKTDPNNMNNKSSLELCRGFALLWNVDRIGVMYYPPGQQGGHCILYEKQWNKEGIFWDYQSNSFIDSSTVWPIGCYSVTFKEY